MPKYFGKYRGKVVNNEDPQGLGRLQVDVPAVAAANPKNWAAPCVPYAGPQVGLFLIPPNQANVWVEFEAGDPGEPIWAGCFWGDKSEMPVDPAVPKMRVFQCEGAAVRIEDGKGGRVELKVGPPIAEEPVSVVVSADAMVVEAGSSKLEISPGQVAINGDGLVVK